MQPAGAGQRAAFGSSRDSSTAIELNPNHVRACAASLQAFQIRLGWGWSGKGASERRGR